MATWIIVAGGVVLALILGGAVLMVFVFTRGENDDDIHLPRFKRFASRRVDGEPDSADGDRGT